VIEKYAKYLSGTLMNVIRYEQSLERLRDDPNPVIFLAGPTVRGNQPHLTSWRFAALDEFTKQGFDGTLVLPEFTSKTETDQNKSWIPKWEYAGLCQSDINMFWVPRTKELIGLTTNHEHGYWMGRCPGKVVYGRPDDSYRNTYLDIMWDIWEQTHSNKILTTLEQTVSESIALSRSQIRHYRQESNIFVASPYGEFFV
jgi:nucleoside 2-deoxyribosyltransferase